MSEAVKIPDSGRLAYLGPALSTLARTAIEERGYEVEELSEVGPDDGLPDKLDLLVLAIGTDHPMRGALQKEAVRQDVPVATDLALLAELCPEIEPGGQRRVVLTGSAGKTVTASVLSAILRQANQDCRIIEATDGYLNALSKASEVLVLPVEPSFVRYTERLGLDVGAVLNLTEEDGGPVGERAREAAASLLTGASVGVLGADDTGAQSLLMAVRRKSASAARSLVPISGGATLSDGWFAIDRSIYAVRNGRTRRVASFAESAVLLGDHFGQDAAAAAAIAAHLDMNDDQIAAGLMSFRGVEGRFDCIGTEGRIVFVDDRFARCRASTEAAIAACPEVFWIGFRLGELPKKTRTAMRGAFYLKANDGSGPPVDNVVTFQNAEGATDAALQAASDLIRRDPSATPVIIFSPGAPGFDRQGELFRLRAFDFLSQRGQAHG